MFTYTFGHKNVKTPNPDKVTFETTCFHIKLVGQAKAFIKQNLKLDLQLCTVDITKFDLVPGLDLMYDFHR